MMRDKKELEKALRYFRHKAEYTVESDERKEMYVIAAEAAEKVLNPDFVQVVRCRECANWKKEDYAGLEELKNFACACREWSDPEIGFTRYTRYDDYCSYGERREEG